MISISEGSLPSRLMMYAVSGRVQVLFVTPLERSANEVKSPLWIVISPEAVATGSEKLLYLSAESSFSQAIILTKKKPKINIFLMYVFMIFIFFMVFNNLFLIDFFSIFLD